MNKIFLPGVVLSLFIFSCSSAPKKEAPKVVETGKTTEDKKVKLVEVKPDGAKPAVPVPIKAPKYDALRAAIATNTDERIRAASVDILQNDPKDIMSLNALAMSYYKKGNYDTAQTLLDKVLANDPNNSTAYCNFGLIRLARGEKREAIVFFKKAIELNSSNEVAAANLGSIYAKEKDYVKALDTLSSIGDSATADEATMTNYGVSLAASGQNEKAAAVYDMVLKKYPNSKAAMLNAAIVKIDRLNKFQEGLDLINRLKLVASDLESRQVIKDLEVKAKAGLK